MFLNRVESSLLSPYFYSTGRRYPANSGQSCISMGGEPV